MSKKREEKLYVIRKIEVEQYHDFCNSYMQKTRLFLKDILCDDLDYADNTFTHLCDVNAQCSALSEVLHGFFDLDRMEYEKTYQMEEKIAATIIKIYLTTIKSIQILKKHRVFLEDN